MIEKLNLKICEIEVNDNEIELLANQLAEALIETDEFKNSIDELASILREIRFEGEEE